MHPDSFDVIPFEDIQGDWKKLGSGSFGNVWRGTYLGIDVAIKEVLPSTSYDVSKYFEREWRLMKECRHPNICLFIGLSRSPASPSSLTHPSTPNRIYIISEYIESGNVRTYIHDTSKPFPWRLRISFATDVSRALAYLHARRCIHRDLKGENLLVTSNARLKITDFGFARIAARNAEESKRLTFCGTDSYMSPEILVGEEFDLSTDVFSLGVIFCEIAARKLADDHTFKRHAPTFALDPAEVTKLASPGCPTEFLELCIDCCKTDPKERPTTREILDRLRIIEAEVLARPSEEGIDLHFGSVRFLSGVGGFGKRHSAAPRIPSFGMGIRVGSKSGASTSTSTSTDESDDEELSEAIRGLSGLGISVGLSDGSISKEPLLHRAEDGSTISEYSTTVVKSSSFHSTTTSPPSLSSILTVRPSPNPLLPPSSSSSSSSSSYIDPIPSALSTLPPDPDPLNSSSILSIATLDSYYTAPPSSRSTISSANATEGGSTIRSLRGNFVTPLVHRFTLLKQGKHKVHHQNQNHHHHPTEKDNHNIIHNNNSNNNNTTATTTTTNNNTGWNPLEMLFSTGLLVGKCDLCNKRFGWKPALECDDCGLRTHVKCGELAPMDCGLRVRRLSTPAAAAATATAAPLNYNRNLNLTAVSPLSKVKATAAYHAQEENGRPGNKNHGAGPLKR